MVAIGTWLFTRFRGELVGTDEFGNRYYHERGPSNRWHRRRWVLYRGEVEASRVPPDWHGWLHHTVNEPPRSDREVRPWQKPHLPNLTGTSAAYRPPGHDSQGGKRAAATGDYEPWTPS
ncbi:MAG: NADH:ubiquinone oxidoreductase subunit NDUFA12 [Alphaproteobacteria bacterium]|nr:NADH:ubiquinone oxidoreductase subunit NDUFA12 [Alphaproteobacteria bacterium]